MVVLQKLWDMEELRLHKGEQQRKDRAQREQMLFEAGLVSDTNTGSQRGGDIAARVLSAAKRRHRQNNTKMNEDANDGKGKGSQKKKTAKNAAMELLHERTKRVLESTRFHMTIKKQTTSHLTATVSVRLFMLKKLLRKKRLDYQKTLETQVHRLVAKRQTTVTLNIEDVRRFLHYSDEHQENRTIEHQEFEQEESERYTGFLMLRSLDPNEIRNLVAKGILHSTGFVVVEE